MLSHCIVVFPFFVHDNKNGIFVAFLEFPTKVISHCAPLPPSSLNVLPKWTSCRTLEGFVDMDLPSFYFRYFKFLALSALKLQTNSPSEPFHLLCDKNVKEDFPSTNHLYLQARVEIGHAYLMYVQLGFTNKNGNFGCTSLQNDCPIPKELGAALSLATPPMMIFSIFWS
jgi:hypothetical protein